MKKRVEEVLKLLLGIVLGLLVIFQFSEDSDVRSFFEFDLGIQRTWQWGQWVYSIVDLRFMQYGWSIDYYIHHPEFYKYA